MRGERCGGHGALRDGEAERGPGVRLQAVSLGEGRGRAWRRKGRAPLRDGRARRQAATCLGVCGAVAGGIAAGSTGRGVQGLRERCVPGEQCLPVPGPWRAGEAVARAAGAGGGGPGVALAELHNRGQPHG